MEENAAMPQPFVLVEDVIGFFLELLVEMIGSLFEWLLDRKRERK